MVDTFGIVPIGWKGGQSGMIASMGWKPEGAMVGHGGLVGHCALDGP